MAKSPPYPPKDKRKPRRTKPNPDKGRLYSLALGARGEKVDPMDDVRPPRRRKPPPRIPYRNDGPPSKITKPFKGPFRGGPSKIIKPYKGPRIKRDDDLRQIGPRKKPKPIKPRGNPNAKYRIVPARKKK